MPDETVVETTEAPPPTLDELHTFLLEVRATAYVSALQTAAMIDEWLEEHPLPPLPDVEEDPAVE
jgi:hypothetical protein